MYDVTADLQIFYDECVRLGKALREELARYRDLNIERLKGGPTIWRGKQAVPARILTRSRIRAGMQCIP